MFSQLLVRNLVDPFLASPIPVSVDAPPSEGDRAERRAHTSATRSVARSALVFGPASQLASIAVALIVAAPLCLPMPAWLRATAIGCTWGALSLAGLGASWSRRRLLGGVYALCLAQLAQRSIVTLASLDHNAAWALVVCVLGGGWAVGILWTPWHVHDRQPVCITAAAQRCGRLARWTIWDIACLATGVAILSWVVPRTETPLHLVAQIAPALVGGVFVSLFAVEWACRDQWSLRRMLAVVIGGALVCGMCLWLTTATTGLGVLGWQTQFRWWLAGPGSVMAAQGLTVLGVLGAARIDMQLAAAPSPTP